MCFLQPAVNCRLCTLLIQNTGQCIYLCRLFQLLLPLQHHTKYISHQCRHPKQYHPQQYCLVACDRAVGCLYDLLRNDIAHHPVIGVDRRITQIPEISISAQLHTAAYTVCKAVPHHFKGISLKEGHLCIIRKYIVIQLNSAVFLTSVISNDLSVCRHNQRIACPAVNILKQHMTQGAHIIRAAKHACHFTSMIYRHAKDDPRLAIHDTFQWIAQATLSFHGPLKIVPLCDIFHLTTAIMSRPIRCYDRDPFQVALLADLPHQRHHILRAELTALS